jgi:hypothetical protein
MLATGARPLDGREYKSESVDAGLSAARPEHALGRQTAIRSSQKPARVGTTATEIEAGDW